LVDAIYTAMQLLYQFYIIDSHRSTGNTLNISDKHNFTTIFYKCALYKT